MVTALQIIHIITDLTRQFDLFAHTLWRRLFKRNVDARKWSIQTLNKVFVEDGR